MKRDLRRWPNGQVSQLADDDLVPPQISEVMSGGFFLYQIGHPSNSYSAWIQRRTVVKGFRSQGPLLPQYWLQ
jgi:hypothetical protein